MFEANNHIKIFIGSWLLPVLLACFATTSIAQQTDNNESAIIDRFYNQPKTHNIRHLLNRFAFSASSGYGLTYYSHKFENAGIIQKEGFQPYIFNTSSNYSNDTINTVYSNWFNKVESIGQFPVGNSDYIVSTDTTDIVFKSRSRGIPILLTLHYEFLRYRIGVGMSWEFHKVKEFRPKNNSSSLSPFQPAIQKEKFKRYFLYLGGRVWTYYEYSAIVDAQIGMYNLGGNFSDPKGFYFNLGVSLNRELSEYFTVFVRPSLEYKRFETSLPESSLTVSHKMPAIFLNIGVQLKFPELPKCKISNCETQLNHTHGGGKEWRSRSHPFFKKQNPHYGENYPKFFKYKWRNRKKLSPY